MDAALIASSIRSCTGHWNQHVHYSRSHRGSSSSPPARTSTDGPVWRSGGTVDRRHSSTENHQSRRTYAGPVPERRDQHKFGRAALSLDQPFLFGHRKLGQTPVSTGGLLDRQRTALAKA